ncbi:chromosome segregation protein [Sphingobium sp. B2D3A]|uniref:chromosome segregation protein SMC n=1 Tax=unclassified Sphingobium TaxID=2611147 RepID=UPI002224CC89|nr:MULTISPECIES: chromosome segregation protein SMC [unclassified Sphingobium]MCW2337142.1 chromosome segregation protein [Sphingobium sp. B2D3A]MCW2383600.1 chromosome segregation protein [Sphingobium sp. B2D3D]
MQIRRLKLTGFKSFVEPTELRIEPGLTGIVGPNGCGKSNLLEAIRWVMGESSPKSMRGGGMDDVIFAGTATRPARDFAEVGLFASVPPGTVLPAIDMGSDGELEVMRRIERGAGSAYRANGRDVRAKDVALLFADAATGPHSPALVSQGKIAAVIAAKPAERRAMLEEAAGIAGLHVRRKDAEQKLRASAANLARLDEILAEMDVRANALRRQARAAERYTELSEKIVLAEGRVFFARHREAATEADRAAQDAEKAEALVRVAQEAQLGAAAHQQSAIETLARARSAANEAREAATEARFALERLTGERDTLLRRIAELESQLARVSEDQQREGALAADAANAIEALQAEDATLSERIKAAKTTLPAFVTRLAEAETASRDAEVALAQAMARLAGEQAERRVAEAGLNAARQKLARARGEAERIASALTALPDAAPLATRQRAAEQAKADALTGRTDAEARIAAAAQARETHTQAVAEQQRALAAARATVAALDSEAKALARGLETQGSGDRAIDALRVDPGYEHALAAALGDDLQAALGAQGLARWSGAAIDARDPALPDGCDALASHVRAPEALARRLAQIAVVEQDDGQPLAVGQRLVTRDGQLRRWDGFVAQEGGGAAAERLIRINRLAAIERERPAVAATVSAAEQALAAAEASLREAGTDERAAREAMSAADTALRGAERTLGEVATALERLAGQRADLDRRQQEASADLTTAERELESAQATHDALPAGDDTAARVDLLKSGAERCRAAIGQVQAERAMAERALAADEERVKAIRSDVAGWKARAGDAVRRVAEMKTRAEAQASELDGLRDRPAALATELDALTQAARDHQAAVERSRSEEAAAEATLIAAEKALANANEALSTAREARAGAQARAEHAVARRREIGQACGERFSCPPPVLPSKLGFASEEVVAASEEQARYDKLVLDRERIGPVNLVAASELSELEETQTRSRAESEELTTAINQLRGSIGHLNREGRQRLLAAFEAVNGHFQRLFSTLFQGGSAHLELIESDDPLEAGLEILAQPPGKRLTTLTLLSGGEQALTAVALIFGLFLTNPAPICVLDEVDAPLDDANIERFCGLLERMVQDTATRYLIVTHNAVTMSRMHRLFGVTMIEQGVSRLVSVDLQAAEDLLAAE